MYCVLLLVLLLLVITLLLNNSRSREYTRTREFFGTIPFIPYLSEILNDNWKNICPRRIYKNVLDQDASSAKTLTFVAVILQIVFLALGIFVVLVFTATSASFNPVSIGPNKTVNSTSRMIQTSFPFLTILILVPITIFSLLWVFLDYFLIYRKLSSKKVAEASTPALVPGILQLIFGGLIPGILLIVAYVKIRDSINRAINQQPSALK
jgi:hypothetical protein